MNEQQQVLVEIFLQGVDPASQYYYWIGLKKSSEDGMWYWEPSHQRSTYFNWGSGEPNNCNGTENYVHLLQTTKERNWNDIFNGGNESISPYALCQVLA
jgi:hypothetical protein